MTGARCATPALTPPSPLLPHPCADDRPRRFHHCPFHANRKRVATIVIPLLILALALHGLANEFDEHGYRAIRRAFRQLSGTQIALTVVLGRPVTPA